ncbi:MAG: hypothetical protein Q8R28_04560 [Dehalococcoidia bacterium]|nr:hypothetical protein [Dehalococcoidia bacterium]
MRGTLYYACPCCDRHVGLIAFRPLLEALADAGHLVALKDTAGRDYFVQWALCVYCLTQAVAGDAEPAPNGKAWQDWLLSSLAKE